MKYASTTVSLFYVRIYLNSFIFPIASLIWENYEISFDFYCKIVVFIFQSSEIDEIGGTMECA